MSYTPKSKEDKERLAQQVEGMRLAGYSDQDIARRLNLLPGDVQTWAEYAERNLARRKPLLSAEAIEEELARVNYWTTQLKEHWDSLDPEVRQEDIHRSIASFQKLSAQRNKLIEMKKLASPTDNSTDESLDVAYEELLSKLMGDPNSKEQ